MRKSLDILWEKVQGMQKALDLQALEYERRLKALNGEGERIKDVLKESIPREVFDRTINTVNDKIAALTVWKNSKEGSEEGKDDITKYIPWIIAFAALAWGIFKNK